MPRTDPHPKNTPDIDAPPVRNGNEVLRQAFMTADTVAFPFIDSYLESGSTDEFDELAALSLISSQSVYVTSGVIDADGYSDRNDTFLRKLRAGDLPFQSPIARSFALNIGKKMEQQFWASEVAGGAAEPVSHDNGKYIWGSIRAEQIGDDDTIELLVFNSKPFQDYLSSNFHISRSDIAESNVRPFMDWLVHSSSENLQRVGAITTKNSESNDMFLEAFLATEFGEDFGDTLLTLRERLPQEAFDRLFEKMSEVRRLGREFSQLFAGYDDQIVGEIEEKMNSRITEVMCVAEAIAVSEQGIATGRVLGNRITIGSMQEVMKGLEHISVALGKITQNFHSGIATPAYLGDERSGWNLGKNGDTYAQIKTTGSERGQYMKGIEHSEEGQINFSSNVLDDEPVPKEIADYRRRYALSVRIDLEGLLRDANGGRAGFDATREQLQAALDLGTLRGSDDNPNVRVGRLIALGNKLRMRKLQQGKSRGYHVTLSQKYGNKHEFKGLAEHMVHKLYRRHFGQVGVQRATMESGHPSIPLQSGTIAA
ncbi:MAG: hypothetical protein ACM3KF_00290 [Acidobacteriota bacterium]